MKRSLVLPLLLLAGCGKPPAQGPEGPPPPSAVTIAPVEERQLIEWEEFTGRVEAMEVVELRPRVSGYITEVHFQAGALVKKDDVLFTIDQRPFKTRLDSVNAELNRVEAMAKAAKQEFDRVSSLLTAKAIAPEQAEARESAHLQALASLAAAQAAQHSAELELSHSEVRAPISGRISRALATPGNYVSGLAGGATILTTIVTVDPVYVYADIDENSLLKLQALRRQKTMVADEQGRVPVELQLSDENDFKHKGFVESFDNRLDPGTGSMILRAQFSNADGGLTPGLFARIRIPMTPRYPALLVDEKAILTDQANKYVLGISDQNMAEYRKVEIGPAIEGRRIIRSGLKAGDKIIVNGLAKVFPGMPVAPVAAPANTAAK